LVYKKNHKKIQNQLLKSIKHDYNVPTEVTLVTCYHSTLAPLTLTILFLEILKPFKRHFFNNKICRNLMIYNFFVLRKFGELGPFFHKILCMCQNHMFQVLKMWKFDTKRKHCKPSKFSLQYKGKPKFKQCLKIVH
jgi:hypothetical protein